MKRRSFLGAMGGAIAAGPKAVKASAADYLSIPVAGGVHPFPPRAAMGGDRVAQAKSELKEFLSKTNEQRDAEKSRFDIERFTANAHALRSANLQTKLAISRRELFDKAERDRENTLRGIISGWWHW